MKKLIIILLSAFILIGCDEIENTVVDPQVTDFSVTDINAPTTLKYFGNNTTLNTSISVSNSESILRMWINLNSQDGTVNITYNEDMVKSNQNEYSISIPMEADMPSLTYTIDYYYETAIQSEKKIASHNFEYDNNQDNVAPVIANPLFYYVLELPILRTTIESGTENEFIVSIEVNDGNGLSDIDSVYLDLYNYQDPNNVIVTKKILLFDDGTGLHGDNEAGDGIYSRKGFFPSDAEGDRKYEFTARDRSGISSNIIIHNFVVVK